MTARFSWNQQNTRGHRPRLQFEIVIECTFGTLSSYEGSFHSCPSSTSPNLGALKADLDAVDLFHTAFDRAGREIEAFRNIDAMDVHNSVIAALGKHVDEHSQRERIVEHGVFGVDVRDTGDRVPQHDGYHFLFDE